MLGLVSSASIACGFHAGDPASISASIAAAHAAGVAVGAHPSFDDRKNFGRTELPLPPKEVFALVAYQVGAFQAVANSLGVSPQHVKPHGALYNMAARDPALAEAVAHGILAVDRCAAALRAGSQRARGRGRSDRAPRGAGSFCRSQLSARRRARPAQPAGCAAPRSGRSRRRVSCGCCRRAWSAASMEPISRSRRRRFACMATRRTRSLLRTPSPRSISRPRGIDDARNACS